MESFKIEYKKPKVEYIRNNIFYFSSCQSKEEMSLLSKQILSLEDDIKPFYLFSRDVHNLMSDYDVETLKKEYNLIIALMHMHNTWKTIIGDEDKERYYLQYRFALDGYTPKKIIPLKDVTLPVDDPYWAYFFPPNGYNFRDLALLVRKDKYPLSNSEEVFRIASKAIKRPFRFNCGNDNFPIDDFIKSNNRL
ncbi:MAG: hypothetical protein LUH50_04115 [Bacteroides intestinalis]|nr:hypothetical protein [Bacteroides intestinalis]